MVERYIYIYRWHFKSSYLGLIVPLVIASFSLLFVLSRAFDAVLCAHLLFLYFKCSITGISAGFPIFRDWKTVAAGSVVNGFSSRWLKKVNAEDSLWERQMIEGYQYLFPRVKFQSVWVRFRNNQAETLSRKLPVAKTTSSFETTNTGYEILELTVEWNNATNFCYRCNTISSTVPVLSNTIIHLE